MCMPALEAAQGDGCELRACSDASCILSLPISNDSSTYEEEDEEVTTKKIMMFQIRV